MRTPIHILSDIPGHPGYRISSRGKVFYRGKTLRVSLNNGGYERVRIDGKRYFVHRLVANTFIPNPHNYPVVMHLDNNKLHNHMDNLKWGTYSENTSQAYHEHRLPTTYKKGTGNGLRGDNHPKSKITEAQREEIKQLYSTGKYTFTYLGKLYGVTRTTIAKYI